MKGPRIQTLVTGMGGANTARALKNALAQLQPALVLSCGFAGGLRPGIKVGTVVFSQDAGARLRSALGGLGAVPALFHCASRIAITTAEKRALFARTGADAVEMESGIVRQICREQGLPCAVIRVISDGPEDDLPVDFNVLLTPEMKIKYRELAWKALRSPAAIWGLLRLQRNTRQAAHVLGDTLVKLLRQLSQEPAPNPQPG